MDDAMQFPKRPEDFLKRYSFRDEKEEYTNGAKLIPVVRVKQMNDYYFTKEQQS